MRSSLLAIAAFAASASAATYSPILMTQAADFFTHFTAFTGSDPTNGFVKYVDLDFANQNSLIGTVQNTAVNETTAFIGIDSTNKSPSGRNSVRLLSKQNFTINSLFVFDVTHVPVAWGQWSAIWLLGQDGTWPGSGEIDIFESVHQNAGNTITLHTSPGCIVDNTTDASGTLAGADCSAGQGTLGCGFDAPSSVNVNGQNVNTAGQGFNDNNGAVIVTEWTTSGINVWMFERYAVPGSLLSTSVDTSTFPQPIARFSGSGCDFNERFREMQIIINIDVCGDWAGKVWESSGAQAATGVATCQDYVANNPAAFEDAYFEIVQLAVYSSSDSSQN